MFEAIIQGPFMSHHFTFVERGEKLNCRIYPATDLYANGVYCYMRRNSSDAATT